MKDSKKLKLNGKEYTITKIPLRRTGELLMSIEKLPHKVRDLLSSEEIEQIDNTVILTKLPFLLSQAQDEIIGLISTASGIDEEVINELGFDEAIDIVTAILEINNLKSIIGKVKNFNKVLQSKK